VLFIQDFLGLDYQAFPRVLKNNKYCPSLDEKLARVIKTTKTGLEYKQITT
jgi:hypothetical protein